MKKLLAIALLATTILSCNNDEDTQFVLNYSEEFVLPATLGIEYAISTDSIAIETDSDEKFNDNETKASLINEALITTLQVSLTGPTGKDLQYVDQMSIYMSATGLDEILIGTIDEADEGDVLLTLDTRDTDVQEYLKATSVSFRIEFTSDDFASQDRNCLLNVRFSVDATKA
jgi:hypothetical protein